MASLICLTIPRREYNWPSVYVNGGGAWLPSQESKNELHLSKKADESLLSKVPSMTEADINTQTLRQRGSGVFLWIAWNSAQSALFQGTISPVLSSSSWSTDKELCRGGFHQNYLCKKDMTISDKSLFNVKCKKTVWQSVLGKPFLKPI